MRALTLALAALLATACTPAPSPAPMPPDATDGAPPVFDASDACTQACATLQALGCPVQPSCPGVLMNAELAHLVAVNGSFLTCTVIAGAKTKAYVQGLGISCP